MCGMLAVVQPSAVMAGLVPAIHVFNPVQSNFVLILRSR